MILVRFVWLFQKYTKEKIICLIDLEIKEQGASYPEFGESHWLHRDR